MIESVKMVTALTPAGTPQQQGPSAPAAAAGPAHAFEKLKTSVVFVEFEFPTA